MYLIEILVQKRCILYFRIRVIVEYYRTVIECNLIGIKLQLNTQPVLRNITLIIYSQPRNSGIGYAEQCR